MTGELDLQDSGEVVLGLGDFNGHVEKRINDFDVVNGGMDLARDMLRGEDSSSFVIKRSCVCVAMAY